MPNSVAQPVPATASATEVSLVMLSKHPGSVPQAVPATASNREVLQ